LSLGSIDSAETKHNNKKQVGLSMKTNKLFGFTMAAGIFCAAGLTAHADTITTGTTITTDLNGGNPYSGNGIPYNGNSTVTTISGITGANGGPSDTVTLALAATAYKSDPTPGNPSYGVYTVNTGVDGSGRSVWNFDFYVSSALENLAGYSFSLTETGPGGNFTFNPLLSILGDGGTAGSNEGNSESLDFAGFGIPIGYNANTAGIYTFTLDVSQGDTSLGGTTITVDDGVPASVPDSAPTLALLGASLAGLVCFKRAKVAKDSVSDLLS
jgi:hypothetical protein